MNAQDFFLRTNGFIDGKFILHLIQFNNFLPMSNEEIDGLRFLRADIFRNGSHVRVSTSPLTLSIGEKEGKRRGESVHPATAGQFQRWIFIVLMNCFIRYSTSREFWIKETFVSSVSLREYTRFVYLCATSYALVYLMFEISLRKSILFKKIFNSLMCKDETKISIFF